MNQIDVQYFNTEFGELILGGYQDMLCLCDWRYRAMRNTIDTRLTTGLDSCLVEKNSAILVQTRHQLEEYFADERHHFDIPLLFVGTDFQKRVWQELINISYGTTTTYLQLSEKLGNKAAIRAVANANGANAISIIVPCHRVIGSDGALVGYAGGLDTKMKLLSLENKQFGTVQSKQITMNF
ncbi:MAG: methylated-DNA--[protein]-cysteine S-methyltransferase [Thermoflexibacter sp.]|jgi:methylated-DNA-[protein]-cysteine S-methyltransferase|nr:methylated-DNA--[protein]-cysteine S-methyltransferase [Thermoflexibacter sp.]